VLLGDGDRRPDGALFCVVQSARIVLVGHLRVHAAGSAGGAADGNSKPLNFTASITDHDGDPVKKLGKGKFDLQALIVGPGGPSVDVGTAAEAMPGVYIVQAIARRPWTDGTYLFVLTIEDGNDRGQTVIPVTISE
jgi:hypothetical protein